MSKRSAEDVTAAPNASTTPIAPALVTSVITIMKDAYGAVPKAFWGLCKGGEAAIAGGTSREFTIDTPDSFKHYCSHLTEPGAYRIIRLRTAGGFNRKITILETVRQVNFGSKFNSAIVFASSETLEEIEFEEECVFNRPIAIPAGVRVVTFSRRFNRTATLPSSLRVAKFGEEFTYPMLLPQGLLELYLGDRYYRDIVLPDGLQVLRLGRDFLQNIQYPNSLRDIEFGRCLPLVLPHGLQRVTYTLCSEHIHNIVFPETLKYASIGYGHEFGPVHNLPLGLEELVWQSNVAVDIPVTVKYLTLGEPFQRHLHLPEDLETIVFMGKYCGNTLDVPEGLKSITLNEDSTVIFTLPEGCVRLYLDLDAEEE